MGPPIGLHGFVDNMLLAAKPAILTQACPLSNYTLAALWALRPDSGTPIGLHGFVDNMLVSTKTPILTLACPLSSHPLAAL